MTDADTNLNTDESSIDTSRKATDTTPRESPSREHTPLDAAELTAFQQTILDILAEEPEYGLGIKRALEAVYGTEINHGRLYPNLDQLVEAGLLAKSELDKRTNEYELTEKGRQVALEHLRWKAQQHDIDVEEVLTDE